VSAALTLTNARVVGLAESWAGTVRVSGGAIAEVAPGLTAARDALDCEGDWLVPGLVELHTDVLERHAAPRPGVWWPERAAVVAHDAQLAASGITTVLDSLAVGYVIDSGQRPRDPRPLVEAISAARATGLLRADHLLHLRCEISTAQVVEHFEPLADHPLLRLVSLMDHTPGQRQFVSLEKYREYNQGKYGLSDREVEALIARRCEEHERFAEKHRAEIVALCRDRRLPLASHDDATVEHVEEAVEAGAVIAEFPTTLDAARAAHASGLAILMGAPNLVCGRSHSGNVSAAELAAAGLLDVLSSDYVPASALHAAFLLHRRHGFDVAAAIRAVTAVPAARAGLADRGEIAPGKRADLVQVRVVEDVPVVRAVWRAGRRVA
jgi:alpha-D-ribose 1-methylphosphonate 5-triphosphate diphosphatase